MKRQILDRSLGLGALLTLLAPSAQAALLANDSILTGSNPAAGEYDSTSAIGGQNPEGLGYNSAWSGSSGAIVSGLSYSGSGYSGEEGSALQTTSATRFGRNMDTDLANAFAGTGTIYLSFLASFDGSFSSWAGYAAFEVGGTDYNDPNKALAIGVDGGGLAGNFMYQVNNGTKTSTAIPSDTNVHHFLVRFDMDAAGTDDLTLWIDPVLTGASDPAGGISVTGEELSIDNIRLGAGGAGLTVDEIRFGTDLASVVPEPSTALLSLLGVLGLIRRRR
ncbi:PEP-CTERM sorting domain-containing protein [Roseibacillus ishigakijimensis]|uniref:PEP-CTERM sorting domain-containing protein n=1 Tax=Roseibacillus ishigakijimensis TaxID=454146 RepID=A0A934RSU7_9BACT|nr:PEP-CTERM sorting domain-containing protein [Roseibacillus ishigakijimensis]MBK1834808.1 PEP-CTERM sorting domain-containing protein [Roseibacillus ishigakijimensis]